MVNTSLVPRPSLTAFFRSRGEKRSTAAKKSCEGRPGYEARSTSSDGQSTHLDGILYYMTNLIVVESSFASLHCRLATPEAMTALHTGSLDCRVGESMRRRTDQSDASMVVTTDTGELPITFKKLEVLCLADVRFSPSCLGSLMGLAR